MTPSIGRNQRRAADWSTADDPTTWPIASPQFFFRRFPRATLIGYRPSFRLLFRSRSHRLDTCQSNPSTSRSSKWKWRKKADDKQERGRGLLKNPSAKLPSAGAVKGVYRGKSQVQNPGDLASEVENLAEEEEEEEVGMGIWFRNHSLIGSTVTLLGELITRPFSSSSLIGEWIAPPPPSPAPLLASSSWKRLRFGLGTTGRHCGHNFAAASLESHWRAFRSAFPRIGRRCIARSVSLKPLSSEAAWTLNFALDSWIWPEKPRLLP